MVFAYLMSVIVGVPVTWAWSEFLFAMLKRTPEFRDPPHTTPRVRWIPALIGVFERAAVTTLMIWAPSATMPFIGGWVVLKIAGGWGLYKEPLPMNRALYMLGLLGNAASLSWAIIWTAFFIPSVLHAFQPR